MKIKQKYTADFVIEIPLINQKFAYGRVMSNQLAVYGLVSSKNESDFEIKFIIEKPILFYVCFFDSVITEGQFKVLGFKN